MSKRQLVTGRILNGILVGAMFFIIVVLLAERLCWKTEVEALSVARGAQDACDAFQRGEPTLIEIGAKAREEPSYLSDFGAIGRIFTCVVRTPSRTTEAGYVSGYNMRMRSLLGKETTE